MAGISTAQDLVKDNKNKGILISIFEQEDLDEHNKKQFEYIYKIKSGENIKIIDYNSDIKADKLLKEGDNIELKVLDDYSAIITKSGKEYDYNNILDYCYKHDDYYIDLRLEQECETLELEIEEKIRKLSNLREDNITEITTYNGYIEVNGKETEGLKININYSSVSHIVDPMIKFNEELEKPEEYEFNDVEDFKQDIIKELKEIQNIQKKNMGDNTYMIGMYNGMECLISVLEYQEPEYVNINKHLANQSLIKK